MSSSIPLPALQVQPPPQSPDLIGNYGRVLQLRNMLQNAPLQNQILQQQAQSGQLQIQQQQMDIAARNALNQAYAGAISKDDQGNTTFDEGKMRNSLMSGPAAFQTPSVMKGLMDFKKSQIDFQGSVSDLQTKQQNMVGNAANAIKASGYNPAVAHALLDQFPQAPQMQQIRGAIDNPDTLKQWTDTAIAQSSEQQKLQNAKDVANIRANTPEAQQQNSWLAQNPGKTPADYAQHKVDMQTQADITRETNPQVMRARETLAASEAAARQAVQDGDPVAAGRLLFNGDVAPSQIISARRPEFAQKAFQAAHDLSGGTWNAQSAEANFKVAGSPANIAFFGSAKSLTDPGGTLDQLANASRNIPQSQIPAFNTIADWEKAETGSGPIAKYASLALGVADDYSKVMGGGQGSDASRAQALKLIQANASPEGRAASLDGIRGAVSSQMNSRIGDNPVLQRMYGNSQRPQAASQTYKMTATGPGGHKIGSNDGGNTWFDTQTGQAVK